jgi:hypothetical protein
MTERDLILLTSYDQVPEGMTEEEAREFWDTYAFTEEYLASAPPVPDDALPPFRPPRKWVDVHLKREDFERARKLARKRGMRVDDLIGELVTRAAETEEEGVRAVSS